MHLFRNVTPAVAIALAAALAVALPIALSTEVCAAEPMHSHHGVTGTSIEPGLGSLHHKVSTRSALAQRFFDQGLRLNYGLNHEAAVHSFRRALELDPKLAMAWWGIALAMGPDINTPMTPEHLAVANEAIAQATALAQHASKPERAYIAALSKRYSTQEGADQSALDAAYRDAMVALSAQAPSDVDAAVLAAEGLMIPHAWKWWHEDGTPEAGTLEAIAALQRALKLQPDHIGANHYYIHAVEMSLHPEAALGAAHRLEALAPAAGHLVHMPAHIYMRTGQYLDAARVNELAAHADEHVHALDGKSDYLPGYHGHNLHFLAVSYLYAGAGGKAMTAGRRLTDLMQTEVERLPDTADYFTSCQFQVAVMFDRWNDVLALPQPPTTLPFSNVFYRFARALAFAGTGHAAQARDEKAAFAAAVGALAPKSDYGYNPAVDVMSVAAPYLDGRLALLAGDVDAAITHLRAAAAAEAKLAYDEPPDWYLASNWQLGTALLKAGDDAGAESAFRADLTRNVAHGRSLAGLAVALRKQGKLPEADATLKQLKTAWRIADVKPGDY